MLQALDVSAPCSSILAPFADAVFELMDSFDSADVETGDTPETWGVYKSAAWVCRKTWRGEQYHVNTTQQERMHAVGPEKKRMRANNQQ